MKRALVMAHVASMIDLFNMDNIHILQSLGYQVDVACNFENGSVTSIDRVREFQSELQLQGINTYHIPIPRSINALMDIIKSYVNMKILIEKNKYDIVHCQSPIGGVIARLASRKSRRNGTKVIYVAHGFHFYKGAPLKNWILYYPIEKICAKFTDCIIVINKEDLLFAKRKFKVNQICYIPGIGIDISKIDNIISNREKVRNDIGVPTDCKLLISVGELNRNKNHEIIIRALSIINNKNIHYVICGKGVLQDYLFELVNELQLKDNVHILGYRDDRIRLLKSSDVFVFPSYREGLSLSMMEAMAVGLPIICSRIRGNIDLIKEEKGGYLFNPSNIVDVTKAIQTILKKSNDFGKFNKSEVKKYCSKRVTKIMESIYKSL